MSKIVVIGSGAWGTALAQVGAKAGSRVMLIARDENIADEINQRHSNKKYLKGQTLSGQISCSTDFGELASCDLVILAVPAQKTRQVIKALDNKLKRPLPVVLTAKGFERQTIALQSQILHEEWKNSTALVLSGPSFAIDVAAGKPTAITLASNNDAALTKVAGLLASPSFRPYVSSDQTGVELCGGLKNIYALACGAIEGAGLGFSARSAFISRAMVEMGRIVAGLGGQGATMGSLAGIGDLVLSCTSEQSRNYRFGLELGRQSLGMQSIEQNIGLVEGVASAPAAHRMVENSAIEAPLIGAVNQLLAGNVKIAQIVEKLMTRPLKSEG